MEGLKIKLGPKQVLEFIVLGIKLGNYEAAIKIAEDCIAQLGYDTEYTNDLMNEKELKKLVERWTLSDDTEVQRCAAELRKVLNLTIE